ncbi:MAG: hypothetical protein U1D30_21595 [Planctomycetota bacterium]
MITAEEVLAKLFELRKDYKDDEEDPMYLAAFITLVCFCRTASAISRLAPERRASRGKKGKHARCPSLRDSSKEDWGSKESGRRPAAVRRLFQGVGHVRKTSTNREREDHGQGSVGKYRRHRRISISKPKYQIELDTSKEKILLDLMPEVAAGIA